jgi:hypothetical protein
MAIHEALTNRPTLRWSAVLQEIADNTAVGDIDDREPAS